MKIALKVLDERIREHLPRYATPGSAGLDLRALLDEPLTINPGETVLYFQDARQTYRTICLLFLFLQGHS